MIFDLILFLIVSFLIFYPLGKLLLSFARFELSDQQITLASIPVGIALFILINYIFAYFQIPLFGLLFSALILGYGIFYKREIFKINIKGFDKLSFLIILSGVILESSLTFFSGLKTLGGMNFYGVNGSDGFVHLALMQSEVKNIPAIAPNLNGFSLRGYHYFYDFFASRFILFFHFSPFDLQFRFIPILILFLSGISLYLFLEKKGANVKRLALFFLYFGQNFTFLWFFFFKNFTIFSSADIPQPIQLIFDPSVILSLSILFTGFYLLLRSKNIKQGILIGIMFGILSETKVYAGIIAIVSLVAFSAIKILFSKDKNLKVLISAILVTAFLTAVTFLPNNLGTVKLIFAPFLIYNHFISQPVFNLFHWALILQVYQAHNNILRIIQMYTEAFLFLWIMTLGLRSIVIFGIYKLFKKDFWESNENIIVLFFIITAVLIPTFFIQNVSVFDIMQFIWVSLVFFGIFAAMVFSFILSKVKIGFKLILLTVIILFSVSGIYLTVKNLYLAPTKVLINKDLDTINEIKNNVSDKTFLVDIPLINSSKKIQSPTDLSFYNYPEISGLTGLNTYYENAIFQYGFLANTYKKRTIDIINLTNDILLCNNAKIETDLKNIGSFNVVSFQDFKCLDNNLNVIKKFKGDNIFYCQFKAIE